VIKKWWVLGRIEDDILITTKGPQTFQQMRHKMAGDRRINESAKYFCSLFCLWINGL
jgi:hypothetical protein